MARRRSVNKSDHELLWVTVTPDEHRHTINTGGDGGRQPNLNVNIKPQNSYSAVIASALSD
jgi:hypothetical protein